MVLADGDNPAPNQVSRDGVERNSIDRNLAAAGIKKSQKREQQRGFPTLTVLVSVFLTRDWLYLKALTFRFDRRRRFFRRLELTSLYSPKPLQVLFHHRKP